MWKYLLSTDFIPVIIESFRKLNRMDCQLDTEATLTNYFNPVFISSFTKKKTKNKENIVNQTYCGKLAIGVFVALI